MLDNEKEKWVGWLKEYGADKFYDAFLKNAQDAKSSCVYCREEIYLDIIEGGGITDWKTEDGDYGCLSSLGLGSHLPKRLEK